MTEERAINWMCPPSTKFIYWNLIPNVVLYGGGACPRLLSHKTKALRIGFRGWGLKKKLSIPKARLSSWMVVHISISISLNISFVALLFSSMYATHTHTHTPPQIEAFLFPFPSSGVPTEIPVGICSWLLGTILSSYSLPPLCRGRGSLGFWGLQCSFWELLRVSFPYPIKWLASQIISTEVFMSENSLMHCYLQCSVEVRVFKYICQMN